MTFADDFDSLILSPNCKPSTGGSVVALCFHDEEAPETNDQAENVGHFFANPNTQASTTGVIDNNSKVGCVPYGQTAWHTGHGDPWNFRIEGYEHSGYARQTRIEWLDQYGVDMLELSAEHFAKRCKALGIPARKIDGAQLRVAVNTNNPAVGGICGHKDISDATDGGHYDPGPNFPWDYFIDRVNHFLAGGNPVPAPAPLEAQVLYVKFPGNDAIYSFQTDREGHYWFHEKDGADLIQLGAKVQTLAAGNDSLDAMWERYPHVGGPFASAA